MQEWSLQAVLPAEGSAPVTQVLLSFSSSSPAVASLQLGVLGGMHLHPRIRGLRAGNLLCFQQRDLPVVELGQSLPIVSGADAGSVVHGHHDLRAEGPRRLCRFLDGHHVFAAHG